MKKYRNIIAALALFLSETAYPQTAAFTYQGRLTDSGVSASGQFDFIFKLFADVSGGAQISGDVTADDVQVTTGVFTVNLSFTSLPFTSMTGNYLEVAVRPGASTGGFTTLTPRQPITSAPYSLQSFNATNLGGNPAADFVKNNDVRLFDARVPTPGSLNYLQNATAQQTASFNISGTGTASILNAESQFNIGGGRVLSNAGFHNVFVGQGAGVNNPPNLGGNNVFLGANAGNLNGIGSNNTSVGAWAGHDNQGGNFNSLFGYNSGFKSTGDANSFFGSGNFLVASGTGYFNTTGSANSFFGHRSGESNTVGSLNSFFGTGSGLANTLGNGNAFFGNDAGNSNTTGSSNTAIGESADVSTGNLSNATAIGSKAIVSQSNSLVLGSINGVNGASAGTNVGIGTTAPQQVLHVSGDEILSTGLGSGFKFRDRGSVSSNDDWVWYSSSNTARFFRSGAGDLLTIRTNGNVGIGTPDPNAKLQVTGGSVYIAQPNSLIITSPNGGCWFITVNNAGALSTIPVTCP